MHCNKVIFDIVTNLRLVDVCALSRRNCSVGLDHFEEMPLAIDFETFIFQKQKGDA